MYPRDGLAQAAEDYRACKMGAVPVSDYVPHAGA